MENKKRDYKKENERQKAINKVYQIKIPRYTAEAFDKKLQEKNETAKSVFLQAIEKFIKKS